MPRGNGTGPAGAGRGPGRRMGSRAGRGQMGGPFAAGPGGNCVCSNCGHQVPHVVGQPCNQRDCPECGTRMTRQ